jgi:hypothetical protein
MSTVLVSSSFVFTGDLDDHSTTRLDRWAMCHSAWHDEIGRLMATTSTIIAIVNVDTMDQSSC